MKLGDLSVPLGSRVVVIGGANTDYVGTPAGTLEARVSNPGFIRTSPGGVARNIAENLARLGVSVELITAFGDDEAGRDLAASCRETSIGIEGSLFVEEAAGARYVAINDAGHDLAVAVSDMRVLEALTPEVLALPMRRQLVASADVIVADSNLSAESLGWLADNVAVPLVIDPVSAAKSARLAGLLSAISTIKPNAQEAEALTGMSVGDLGSAQTAACGLVQRGVGAAFVTLGAVGIAWADTEGAGTFEPARVTPVNTSGAGDAFSAGIVYSLLAQAPTAAQARFASGLSILALESQDTVNPEVSRERVLALIARLYGSG